MGDVYKRSSVEYIISIFMLDSKRYAALISMEDGNRFNDCSVQVEGTELSEDDWAKISSGKHFKLIKRGKHYSKEQIEEKKGEEPEEEEEEEVDDRGIMQLAELFEEEEDGKKS